MAELVPATAEMLRRFDTMPKTVRAIAAIEDDTVLGVTGFYPQHGRLVLFAGISDEARSEMKRHRRTLVAAARRLMAMTNGMPLVAWADPNINGSDMLLKHLGFTPTADKDIYAWPGHR